MFGFLKKNPTKHGSDLLQHAGTGAKAVDVSGFNKVMNFSLYALALLTPVLFLPWTSEILEFNKQALVFFLTVLMLGIWVVKILTTRKVTWVKTSLDYILLVYLGVYLITSLLSFDKVSSFLGYYGRFTGSFISILSMIILYFLLVNNVKTERVVAKITNFYLWGTGIVLLYSFFQLIGWYVIPGVTTHTRGFNPIGSMAGLAIYTALSLVFMQWYWLMNNPGRIKRYALALLTLVGLAIMFIINAFVAWLILALAIIAFLAIAIVKTSDQTSPTWFWRPMLVLVISVLFVAFNFLPQLSPRRLVTTQLPIEVQLSNSTTWNLVGNSYKQGAKNIFLGSGPGTTGIVFGSIKPTDLNKTIVWDLNFDRASSELASIALESGILGLLVFELTSLLFLFYGLFFLMKRGDHAGWSHAFGFFMVFLALYITHFFYFFNTTFYFLYWFSIGIFMAIAHMKGAEQEDRDISFASSPRSALSWMFASLLILAGLLVGVFFQAAQYAGELAYAAGLREYGKAQAENRAPNLEHVAQKFSRAVLLNPYRDAYYLGYGQNLIFMAAEEANKEKPDQQRLQNLLADVIPAGQAAVDISPNKSSNWAALSQFYANIKPLASNADEYIIKSLVTALERDPNNPALHYQLSQAYIAASQVPDTAVTQGTDTDNDGLSDAVETRLASNPQNPDTDGNGVMDGAQAQSGLNPSNDTRLTAEQLGAFTKTDPQMIANAKAELNKAIELKDDLPQFYIQLSRVWQRENKLDEAKKIMDDAISKFPNNPDVVLEQGIIAYNQKNYNDAERIFQRLVALVPNDANTHYVLGLVYQQKGDKARALASFEKAREISGENAELDRLIQSLKQ